MSDTAYAEGYAGDDETDVPFDINDPVDVDDLSDQVGGVVEPASKVRFIIKKASVRTQLEDNKRTQSEANRWKVKGLTLELAVGTDGVDGEGRYAGKRFFPELVLAMNTTDFPDAFASDWWKREARYPTKQFLAAMGYDPTQPPRIDDAFLTELSEREVVGDIKRKEQRRKGGDGKYHGTGEQENSVENFRSAD